MPGSRKHQQERSITNRSGQQYPGEIAAGGGGLGRAKDIMQEKCRGYGMIEVCPEECICGPCSDIICQAKSGSNTVVIAFTPSSHQTRGVDFEAL